MDDSVSELKRCRRWKSEIELSGKREKQWRDEAEKIVKKYRGIEPKRNSFNILWSNTEILRPAIYNSLPKPDVRRRFRDSDPVGKAIAEILERSLYVITDHYDTDCAFKNDALDACLVGRAVSRVRYEPKISSIPIESDKDDKDEDDEPEVDERLDYEECCIDHVDWKDFRHGFGRIWVEVQWVSFRHQMTEDEAEKKFGEDAVSKVKFAALEVEEEKNREQESEIEKVAEFWEVWDKMGKQVFFTQKECEQLLFPLANPQGQPPLNLHGFFPCPEPMRIVENTGSLLPIPIYRLYEQQANELDKISVRINKIVDALKLRGAYDSSLSEIGDIMAAGDNDMVAVSRAAAWRDNGGLDKALTWMPIGPAATVLESLNKARDVAKQVIYEITGISDIVRGASVASETATAQQIKAQYASVRLKKMQGEMQRYTRDILRLCAEVVAEKFGQDTMSKMTGLQFPTKAQQQQVQQHLQMQQQQAQQMAMQAQQAGQQPPPPPPPPDEGTQTMLAMPNWESLIQVLRNDALRDFKIDVETDSTVAASLEGDMQSLSQIVTSIGQTMNVFMPLVQEGALPIDSAKQIILAVCRRAKLGLAVEDSIEKMQQPAPKQPEPPPPDHSAEVAQIKAQSDSQMAQMKEQGQSERDQLKAQMDAQSSERELQFKAQMDQAQKQHEQSMESFRVQAENLRTATELETRRQISDATNATNLRIAELSKAHDASMQSQTQQHETSMATLKSEADQKLAMIKVPAQSNDSNEEAPTAAEFKEVEADPIGPMLKQHIQQMSNLVPLMTQAVTKLASPRQIVRGDDGKIVGLN